MLKDTRDRGKPDDGRPGARTAATGAPIRHPGFRRLWLGLSISPVAQPASADRWLGFAALFSLREQVSLRYVGALTLLSLVFFFSYGPLEAALPVYGKQALHVDAGGYGLLWTGFGVGAFTGVLTLTKLFRRGRPGIVLPMIAVLWGALLCPLFFIRRLPLAMLFLGMAGASWAPYTPIETTVLQRLVPAQIRGQVFGARHSLVAAATPLGAAVGGVLLQYLSAAMVVAVSGLACISAGLGGLVALRSGFRIED